MENFLNSSKVAVQEFLKVPFDVAYIVFGILSVIFSAAIVIIFSKFCKKIRRFPVKVNCWFCNNNTSVPYDVVNSWDCPHCKQYNGFSEDGGYNKIIEEQYNPNLNKDIFNTLKPSNCKTSSQSNGFCKLCNINQQLKIQQLALFTPIDENKYYEEIEKYREKLEKAYKLCTKCEGVLKETLERQDYNLLQDRLNGHKQSFSSQKIKTFRKFDRKKLINIVHKNGIVSLNWICLIVALLQFIALIIQFDINRYVLKLPVLDLNISELILKNLSYYMAEVYKLNKELSFAGFVSCLVMCATRQVKKDHNNILAWGLLHISFWSNLIAVQMVLSGLCVYMSTKACQKQSIYINKKLLHKKLGFQPVKKVFPEVQNISSESDVSDQVSFPLSNNETFKCSKNQNIDVKEFASQDVNTTAPKKLDSDSQKRKPRKEDNEEEPVLSQEKFDNNGKSACESSKPLSSSLFNKSFLKIFEPEKDDAELNGSFNEVNNGLNGLHLGGKQKKLSKPSNFLFSSPFSQIKNSSIIKPAKFIKNLSSTSWSESSEYNSRSSTPSSQKTEKTEANRFDSFRTVMPVSVSPFGRQSPIGSWNYDSTNGIYNNFSYFSHGFLPFQQYPSPMGHTAIYTSSKPTNYPFIFSPWQGFPNPKFSPTPHFSDSSDCGNIFQDASKTFEKHKKWYKLKRFSYYFSLVMNIFTLFGLFYFISTGIILVDWKLPVFNFFQ